MNDSKTNQLIDLIYEAAIEPSKWMYLLNGLAELVDSIEKQPNMLGADPNIFSSIPSIVKINNEESSTSISEALKSVSTINENEIQPKATDVSEINDILIEHFARAIKIAKRLVNIDDQHKVVLSLLDQMPIALVLVDSEAKIIETNALADEILQSEFGLKVTSNILISGEESNRKLHEAIEAMSKHDSSITQGQSLFITNEQSKDNVMLFIAPLKQHGTQQASVAVFISQRKTLALSLPKEMSNLYGLTKKELIITEYLIQGLNIKDISEEVSISQHTVRSHIKSVLSKTGTSRQTELVCLIYNSMGDFVNAVPRKEPDKRKGLLKKSKTGQLGYKILELGDGRNLAYNEYGDLNGEPVIHCHSIFGSRLELAFDAHKIAQQKSVHLIVLDRPGFGASDPNPEANFINWSKDLVQLADHLKIGKFSLTGYVMGGMYALACASVIPERVKKVALISNCMVPESSSDYKEFNPLYRMNLRLAKYMPKAYGLISSILAKGVISDTGSFIKQMSENLNPTDKAIMDSMDFKEQVIANLKQAFIQGSKASSKEVIQYMNNWSFELSDIKTPVDIWQGESDCHQPLALSKRLAAYLKNTTLHIEKNNGHYLFFSHWAEILDELLSKNYEATLKSSSFHL